MNPIIPCTKILHKTRIDAIHNQVIFQLYERDETDFHVYKCNKCNYYHISKKGLNIEFKQYLCACVKNGNKNTLFIRRMSKWCKLFDVFTEDGIFRVAYDNRGKGLFTLIGVVEDEQVFSFYKVNKNFLNSTEYNY